MIIRTRQELTRDLMDHRERVGRSRFTEAANVMPRDFDGRDTACRL